MHDYGAIASRHYAAYRPPLHAPILHAALGERRFGLGLDLGSGAGRSAIALKAHCDAVIGVEPSAAMLAAAIPAPGVDYRRGDERTAPVAPSSVDIVTMAGVLSYLERTALAALLQRVCRAGAVLLVYDFRIDTGPLMTALSVAPLARAVGYDHGATLAETPGVAMVRRASETQPLSVTAAEATHLLLSNEARARLLAEVFDVDDPEAAVAARLAAAAPAFTLDVQTWRAEHRLS